MNLLVRVALLAYPRSFRRHYGTEWARTIADMRTHSHHSALRIGGTVVAEAFTTAIHMRWENLMRPTKTVLTVIAATITLAALMVGSEAIAVLAGDGLLASAFECLTRAPGYEAEQLLGAVGDLSHAAGSLQLVGGQVDDLSVGGRLPSADEVEQIHLRKTAALMTAAVVGGARLAGAGPDDLARLRDFA